MFDKTGTLTKGVFEVRETHEAESAQGKLLEYAALAPELYHEPKRALVPEGEGAAPEDSQE